MDLKQINAELKSLTIAVRDSNVHRRLNSLQKRHDKQKQSVATLLIPNRLYILWSKKRKLPYCEGCNSVFKHSALANLCLEKGATLAEVQSVEDRLTKQMSKVVNKHKEKRGGSRTKLENSTSHFMVFEGEITQTTATLTTVNTENSSALVMSTTTTTMNTTIKLQGKEIHVVFTVTNNKLHAGRDYEELKPRQRSRRRWQIGRAVRGFTSPLIDIGLKVIGLKFQTSYGNILPIQLGRKIRSINQRDENMDAIIPNVAHLLLRYGVSVECYHEITKIIGGPKSYKVTILYKFVHYTCTNI